MYRDQRDSSRSGQICIIPWSGASMHFAFTVFISSLGVRNMWEEKDFIKITVTPENGTCCCSHRSKIGRKQLFPSVLRDPGRGRLLEPGRGSSGLASTHCPLLGKRRTSALLTGRRDDELPRLTEYNWWKMVSFLSQNYRRLSLLIGTKDAEMNNKTVLHKV